MFDSMNIDIIHVSTCLHRAWFLCHPLSTVQPGLGPLVATQVTWASASPRQPMHSLMLGIQWPWVWWVWLFLRVCRVSCVCLALLKLPEEAFKGDNLKRCMLFGVGCWRFMAPTVIALFPFTWIKVGICSLERKQVHLLVDLWTKSNFKLKNLLPLLFYMCQDVSSIFHQQAFEPCLVPEQNWFHGGFETLASLNQALFKSFLSGPL